MKTEILKQMMNAKIGAIAGTTVDVTVLSGRKKGGIYLTVEIEAMTIACKRDGLLSEEDFEKDKDNPIDLEF